MFQAWRQPFSSCHWCPGRLRSAFQWLIYLIVELCCNPVASRVWSSFPTAFLQRCIPNYFRLQSVLQSQGSENAKSCCFVSSHNWKLSLLASCCGIIRWRGSAQLGFTWAKLLLFHWNILFTRAGRHFQLDLLTCRWSAGSLHFFIGEQTQRFWTGVFVSREDSPWYHLKCT